MNETMSKKNNTTRIYLVAENEDSILDEVMMGNLELYSSYEGAVQSLVDKGYTLLREADFKAGDPAVFSQVARDSAKHGGPVLDHAVIGWRDVIAQCPKEVRRVARKA